MIYLYEHSIYTWFICFTECIHISWQWNVFYMYQANDKTIIRHAKNLNMFKEQLSYLEEAEKRGQKSELFNLPVDDCKVMIEQDTDTVHLYNPHNKY